MAHTAPSSFARGLSTLAEAAAAAAAAARNLAQGMPSTSTETARTLALNPPSDSENPRLNAHRRLELEDRVEEEDEEEGEEKEQADESVLKALRQMGIRAPKQFDPKRNNNFESWLERTEFYLVVNKCLEDNELATAATRRDLVRGSQTLKHNIRQSLHGGKIKIKRLFCSHRD